MLVYFQIDLLERYLNVLRSTGNVVHTFYSQSYGASEHKIFSRLRNIFRPLLSIEDERGLEVHPKYFVPNMNEGLRAGVPKPGPGGMVSSRVYIQLA